MKLDFHAMGKKELRAYVLAHKEDLEAFNTFVDRLKADNPNSILYPAPLTPEAIEIMEKAIKERLDRSDG